MIRIALGFWFGVCLSGSVFGAGVDRPNIVIILADDLGFSDLGCYGGEIQTPNLDRLADRGLRFTQFYNTARCWPTRAALMTGYYAQQVRRDSLDGKGGGQGTRPDWAPLVAQTLRESGYRTYHSGKWHLDGKPLATGFDHSYNNNDSRNFYPRQHFRDDVKLPPVAPGTDYYSTTAITQHAIECLVEHQNERADQPFFSYVAYITPHFPLHAPPADIAKYDGVYSRGWDATRQARFERQNQLFSLNARLSPLESTVGPPYHFDNVREILGDVEVNREVAWDTLKSDQQVFQATKMQIHAAMVDRIDQEVGRLVETLRAAGKLDNTLVMFLSDNGASSELMIRGDGHNPEAAPGSGETHLCLGPGWSSCANTPFRRHKTWVHEGGIATPLIVHWPNQIRDGGVREQAGHVIDIVPTLLEVAGAKPQALSGAPQRPGRSLVPAITTNAPIDREYLWWLHEGNRAIRRGDWKLVAAANEPWELYDLGIDRSETSNLAEKFPDRVAELESLWQSQVTKTRELMRDD